MRAVLWYNNEDKWHASSGNSFAMAAKAIKMSLTKIKLQLNVDGNDDKAMIKKKREIERWEIIALNAHSVAMEKCY